MYKADTKNRYVERILWLLAGILVIVGTLLGYFLSFYRLILPCLVAINLIIFALTGYCLMAHVLTKIGVRSGLRER